MKQLKNFKGNSKSTNGLPKEALNDPRFNDAMNKYGGLNEDELVTRLITSVQVARENGTYNPQQMNNYVQMLKNNISPKQYEKLTNIINLINNEQL